MYYDVKKNSVASQLENPVLEADELMDVFVEDEVFERKPDSVKIVPIIKRPQYKKILKKSSKFG